MLGVRAEQAAAKDWQGGGGEGEDRPEKIHAAGAAQGIVKCYSLPVTQGTEGCREMQGSEPYLLIYVPTAVTPHAPVFPFCVLLFHRGILHVNSTFTFRIEYI
jgi:hypothetical protein